VIMHHHVTAAAAASHEAVASLAVGVRSVEPRWAARSNNVKLCASNRQQHHLMWTPLDLHMKKETMSRYLADNILTFLAAREPEEANSKC
jgi:hypothetical protein